MNWFRLVVLWLAFTVLSTVVAAALRAPAVGWPIFPALAAACAIEWAVTPRYRGRHRG